MNVTSWKWRPAPPFGSVTRPSHPRSPGTFVWFSVTNADRRAD